MRPAPPERQMVGRVAGDVEAVGVGIVVGVAVAGGEPDDHLVAGGDVDVAHADVAGGGPAEEPHGRGEPEQLLGGRRDQLAVGAQALVLLGMLGERERAEADRLPRRLVPGHDQQRERVVEVLIGHRLALDLAVRDQAEHVVAGAGAPVGVELAADRAQLVGPRGAERLVAVLVALAGERVLADVLGVGVDQQPVAEVDQVGQDLLGQTEDVREHADRDRRRELVHEVELALRQDLVEPVADQLAQPLLVARDRARGELRRDQPAVAAVLGRVELEEVPARGQHVLGQVLDRRRAAELR